MSTDTTTNTFFDQMRQQLSPKGTAPLVRLGLRNHGFVEHDLVVAAINELERRATLGKAANALDEP